MGRLLSVLGAGCAFVLTYVAAFPHADVLVNDAPLLRLLAFVSGVVTATALTVRALDR